MKVARYLGLMSGTSMNGVDAAVCEFSESRLTRVLGTATRAYSEALRTQLLYVAHHQPSLTLTQLGELDAQVADVFALAAQDALQASGMTARQIQAIGSHGQTVFHAPDHRPSLTLQIGDPNRIATQTGITTIADLRRRDVVLGGQGAPLVPAFHQAQFADAGESRVIVNIGGIANLSILPGDEGEVRGFDTGPGNGLMDEWIHEKLGRSHDENGAWAASGECDPRLLAALLSMPYFARHPPKSTGRAEFCLGVVRQTFAGLDQLDAARVQRTFCELTARSITDAIRQHAPDGRRVLLCGGGARNKFLCSRLRDLLQPHPVEPTDAHGLDAEWVEAAAFAWLAMRTLNGLPGNLPAVTGASKSAILGGIYPA